MWSAHGLDVEEAHGFLLTRRCPPPFYPNAVAFEQTDMGEQVSFLTSLARGSGEFAVKDSFSVLPLVS